MTALAHYDHACAALAAAVSADEVMTVRLEAKAIEAVARVAKNLDLEIQAVRLRTRAELRLGEMLIQGEQEGIIARCGRQPKDSVAESLPRATLKEIGVDGKLSALSRRLSGIGIQAVTGMLERFEQESRGRGRLALDVIHGETASRNADSRRQLARELSEASALSPIGRKFPVLYADPAWRRKAGIGDRAYENHYVTMLWEELLAMPVANRLLPDAWGYIWIPRAHLLALIEVDYPTSLGVAKVKLPLAWAIAHAWGFDSYSTCLVWTKTDEEHPDVHGMGLIAWDQDELLLLFKRGRGLPKPDTDKKYGSNHRERAGEHSAKPEFYRQMINDMTGSVPVLELFAREDDEHPLPPNFFTWGNQSNNTAEAPALSEASPPETTSPQSCGEGSAPSPQGQSLVCQASEAGGRFPSTAVAGAAPSQDPYAQLEIPPFLWRGAPRTEAAAA